MSFFNFTPATSDKAQAWTVSDKFWVYWIFAVPVTAGTVAVWFWWQRTFLGSGVDFDDRPTRS